jgi:hypothetical protein
MPERRRRGETQLLRTSRLIALLMAVTLGVGSLTACGPFAPRTSVQIEWINFVRFHGITYQASTIPIGRAPTAADLGPVFATVRFQVADNVQDPNYQLKDGDAAFLAAGTPVYTVTGYAPTFRLAAHWAGGLAYYEASDNAHATVGADLLDVSGKVLAIGINPDVDRGTTEAARISDAPQVAHLVALLLAAPVTQRQPQATGTHYFLVLYLRDGTAVVRMFSPDVGLVQTGIMVPAEFTAAVRQALGHA